MSDWNDERPWYNDRIIETIISSEDVDYHGEVISAGAIQRVLPFLAQHGIYNYWHSNFPIGEIIGWKINDDGKPVIKVGIHDTLHSNIPQHDDVWKEIKTFGTRGMSSIEGVSNVLRTGGDTPTNISDMGLWAVAWVGEEAANPNAYVTYVNECAKIAKGITMIPDNSGNLQRITNNNLIKQYIDEQVKKALGGKDMTTIKKEEEEDKPSDAEMENEEEKACGTKKEATEEADPSEIIQEEVEGIEKQEGEDEEEEEPAEEELPPADEESAEEPAAEEEIPAEEMPPEEEAPTIAEAPSEEVETGIASRVAQLEQNVGMLATAVEIAKPATPEAISDAAEAAEVVTEIMEEQAVESAVTEDEPEENNELIVMRKELEALKQENLELKSLLDKPVEKTAEKPQRRGVKVQVGSNVGDGTFSADELIKMANKGKAQEYIRNTFRYDRKRNY